MADISTTIGISKSRNAMFCLRLVHPLALIIAAQTCCMVDAQAATAGSQAKSDEEAAYTKVVNERADKIVRTLEIDDESVAARVQKLIVDFYRGLREIHDTRDARLAQAKDSPGGSPTVAEAWIKVARDDAALKLADLHRRFVARLSVELTPEQVERVKDGLTYGVVPITYKRYLELLPDLNDEQKREVLANLIEARELAMDGGSSEEKHAIFGKFKGRINNYLSKEGYDLKAAEQQLSARQKALKSNR
jgi:hypothetical protein